MYFKYYGVIVTYHAAEQVNQVTAVKNSVFSLMDPYYLLIFTDIIVLGFYFFINKNGRTYKKTKSTVRMAGRCMSYCSRSRSDSACSIFFRIRRA